MNPTISFRNQIDWGIFLLPSKHFDKEKKKERKGERKKYGKAPTPTPLKF